MEINRIKIEKYVSTTDLVRNLSEYINLVQKRKWLVILRKNKPEIAMVSVEEYNKLLQNQKEVGDIS